MSSEEFESKIAQAIEKAKIFLVRFRLSPTDIDDVVQDASVKAFKNISSFRGASSFDTWFCSIARNEALNLFSKRKTRSKYFIEDFDATNYSPFSEAPTLEEEYKTRDYHDLISSCLGKLSNNHREVIDLMLKNSSSYEEISQILSIPVGSVRTRFFYAKKRMKKLIKNYAHKRDTELFSD